MNLKLKEKDCKVFNDKDGLQLQHNDELIFDYYHDKNILTIHTDNYHQFIQKDLKLSDIKSDIKKYIKEKRNIFICEPLIEYLKTSDQLYDRDKKRFVTGYTYL
jgi:hypothetical protein